MFGRCVVTGGKCDGQLESEGTACKGRWIVLRIAYGQRKENEREGCLKLGGTREQLRGGRRQRTFSSETASLDRPPHLRLPSRDS